MQMTCLPFPLQSTTSRVAAILKRQTPLQIFLPILRPSPPPAPLLLSNRFCNLLSFKHEWSRWWWYAGKINALPCNSMAAVLKYTTANKVQTPTLVQNCSLFHPPYYMTEGRVVGTEFVHSNLHTALRSPIVSLSVFLGPDLQLLLFSFFLH